MCKAFCSFEISALHCCLLEELAANWQQSCQQTAKAHGMLKPLLSAGHV